MNLLKSNIKGDVVVEVNNVTKTYALYKSSADRVKEALHPFREKYHRLFHALHDISFKLEKGDTLGIIGQNGSGKSTLLEILCGISKPTSGSILVNGRISALLELGAGFNPEFTGRENVYINSTILGLKEKEIDARFSMITDFADIGDFIDQPVKIYSSGMYIRLAFATAINTDPDILVVDEVLAVGDIYYQHKCMHRMKELISQGTTILFVSHDMSSVKALCNKAILLENGTIAKSGTAEEVVNVYYYRTMQREKVDHQRLEANQNIPKKLIVKNNFQKHDSIIFKKNAEFSNRVRNTRSGTGEVRIQFVEILNDKKEPTQQCLFDEWIIVRGHIECFVDCGTPNIGFIVRDKNGTDIIGTNLFVETIYLPPKKAGDLFVVDFKFRNILQNGTYSITFAVSESDEMGRYNIKTYDWVDNAIVFVSDSGPGKHIHTKVSIPIDINSYDAKDIDE